MDLTQFLDRPIAYHRAFIPFSGVSGAILLSQALYWSNRTSDADGWFYKTRDEWEDETGLGRKAQENAREKLIEAGVMEEKLKGIPAKLHFKINKEVLTSLLQRYQQDGTKGTNKLAPNVPTNTENTTEITTEKEKNTKKEDVLPIIGYIEKMNEQKNDSKSDTLTDEELEYVANDILQHFNKVYDTKYRSLSTLTHRPRTTKTSSLDYWLSIYSVDEIKQAITNSKLDSFWKDKITPIIFFRRTNPNHEPVDHIGSFLNLREAGFDKTPVSDLRLWQLAGEMNIHPKYLIELHNKVKESAETGGKLLVRYKSIEDAVIGWANYGISHGKLHYMGEIEKLDYPHYHPDELKKIEEAKKLMEEIDL